LASVNVNLVCFRYNPDKGKERLNEEKLEELNKELMEKLNSSGKLYLTHTKLKGKYCLRMSIGQTNTQFTACRRSLEVDESISEEFKYL